jgi:hypothetical protein
VCVLVGWSAFALLTVALQAVTWTPASGLALALAAFALAPFTLPRLPDAPVPGPAPAWDLALRMGASIVLVLAVTSLAAWLGPQLTGAITPFPIATTILLAFTHTRHLVVQGAVWLGGDALASRGSARPGPRAARRSA